MSIEKGQKNTQEKKVNNTESNVVILLYGVLGTIDPHRSKEISDKKTGKPSVFCFSDVLELYTLFSHEIV
jgi:hypothetical protein